jgi:hypothetical protein
MVWERFGRRFSWKLLKGAARAHARMVYHLPVVACGIEVHTRECATLVMLGTFHTSLTLSELVPAYAVCFLLALLTVGIHWCAVCRSLAVCRAQIRQVWCSGSPSSSCVHRPWTAAASGCGDHSECCVEVDREPRENEPSAHLG